MSANVDLTIDKIGTKLVEPLEKEPDKLKLDSEKDSSSSPSHHHSTSGNPAPKIVSSEPNQKETLEEICTSAPAAAKEENSSNSEILNKIPVEDDQSSNDSLIFKIADNVVSTTAASADTGTGSPGPHSAARKTSITEKTSDESDFSPLSIGSSSSSDLCIFNTSTDSSLDDLPVTRVKRVCNNEDDSINIKKLKVNGSSVEGKGNGCLSNTFLGALQEDSLKLPKSNEKTELLNAALTQPLGKVENSVSDFPNHSSSSQIQESVSETDIPPPGALSVLSNELEASDSNNSSPETLLEGVHVSSPVFCEDPVEGCENSDVLSEDLASNKMKGEVATATMSIPETRSPMIHIPAGIVSEFMNSESSLSPVTAKPAKKSTTPTNNYFDDLVKSNNVSSGDTLVVNGSSKSVGVAEKSQDVAMEVNTELGGGEGLASAPLTGSTPPDPWPAKPASPAALSNPPIPVLTTQSIVTDNITLMDISNDLVSFEKRVSSPLTNGTYASSSLCAQSDPLGDISSYGSSSVSDDPMSRSLLTPLTGTVATPVLLADDEIPQSTDITELAPVRSTYISNSYLASSTSNLDNSTTKSLDVRKLVSPAAIEVNDSEKNNLKRALSTEDEQINKKLRLSPEAENNSSTSAEIQAIEDDASKALLDAEVQRLKHSPSKLRRLKRKDLENMIVDLFMNKVLHNHELGKYKSLCEKLETTLESNRKKAAQFHKELDDLRKVTRKLQEEHQNRKDHLVTPIKIKRSVGIQAAPHIIQKGIAAACGEPFKNQGRSQHAQNNGTSSQHSMMLIGNSSLGTSAPQSGSPQNTVMRTSFSGVRLGLVSAANGSPGDRRGGASQPHTSQMNSANKSNAVIDLTDEEESRTPTTPVTSAAQQVAKAPQNVVKVTTASGFVSLPTTSGAAQYVLVPSSSSGSVVVTAANVATNSHAGTSTTSTRLLLSSIPSVMTSKASTPALLSAAPVTSVAQQQQPSPHPAPLPRTAPQQVVGGAKQLPPQPTLKLSHKDNSIVLSWTMAKTSEHEAIASYQLFAYQESNQPPSPSLWKKVGSVKALELPMACTLTQFMPGHRYHFAVRAVDAKSRLGPFSEPRSIRLEK